MKPKIGVILSGCGVFDGSEIHESVLTLLFIDRSGADAVCMAPDVDFEVVNHLNQTGTSEKRNVLIESARIARGDIKNITEVSARDIDALILPGGFGAAKNLSDFAVKGADAKVEPDVERLIQEMIREKKPVGAICIAPATLAKAIADVKPEVTIGIDEATASNIEKTGAVHVKCGVDMIHVDEKNRLVTTPAYMLGPGIKEVSVGIEKLVQKIVSMIS